jgi:hypothetical protein
LGVAYHGSVSPDAIFDPNMIGGFVLQIKNKAEAATPAEKTVRPIGIPRDLDRPLPYLTLLMELGNESVYQDTRSKIKTTASQPPSYGQLRKLTNDWTAAVDELVRYRSEPSPSESTIRKLRKDLESKQLAMEDCYRYSILVRGASSDVYGILAEAGIVTEFTTLLGITTSSPTPEAWAIQHMRPLKRLVDTSPYTAWMSEYVIEDEM